NRRGKPTIGPRPRAGVGGKRGEPADLVRRPYGFGPISGGFLGRAGGGRGARTGPPHRGGGRGRGGGGGAAGAGGAGGGTGRRWGSATARSGAAGVASRPRPATSARSNPSITPSTGPAFTTRVSAVRRWRNCGSPTWTATASRLR